ncbi:MAG: transporter substrate-binding domain-containing protein, partial [Pseudomonadota bacterium]
MKMKRLMFVLLALAMTLGMVGTAMAGTLDEIVKRGELRVAVQSGAAPYAFVDKNGNHTGSMVEFAREMAKRMGVKMKILDFDWDGLIPALLSGKADILAADMTPTLKRALKITFCDPWYYVQPCIFTKTGASYQTLADVNKP